jgi:hypothetical protein
MRSIAMKWMRWKLSFLHTGLYDKFCKWWDRSMCVCGVGWGISRWEKNQDYIYNVNFGRNILQEIISIPQIVSHPVDLFLNSRETEFTWIHMVYVSVKVSSIHFIAIDRIGCIIVAVQVASAVDRVCGGSAHQWL